MRDSTTDIPAHPDPAESSSRNDLACSDRHKRNTEILHEWAAGLQPGLMRTRPAGVDATVGRIDTC
jgi:hypothetical protein